MNSGQRLIKYIAIAFAVCLAVFIISVMVSVVSLILNIIPGNSLTTDGVSKERTDYTRAFENVTSLDIDNSIGEFKIMTGEGFLVEAENVTGDFKAEVDSDGTLEISDYGDSFHIPFLNFRSYKAKVILYLPEGFVAEKADIEAGAGNLTIEGLQADQLQISAGIGNLNGRDITAQSVDIDGGVGNVNLEDVYFTDAVLECGMGNLEVNGTLLGKTDIDCGVGGVNLNLNGSPSEYGFVIDSGIGGIHLNGEKISGEYRHNTQAPNVIEVDGGIGSVNINIAE